MAVAFASDGIRSRWWFNKINILRTREGSPAVAFPPPLALAKAFSRSGWGRIFPLFSGDMRAGADEPHTQAEREAISRRTKEALAVAKARGVRLGNPNGAAALRRAGKGGVALRATVTENADRHAKDLEPVIADLRRHGITSLRGIAEALSERGMLTRRGGRWHVSNVRNLLGRVRGDPE